MPRIDNIVVNGREYLTRDGKFQLIKVFVIKASDAFCQRFMEAILQLLLRRVNDRVRGLIPELAMCSFVLGKDTLRSFSYGAKQSTCCGGLA